MRETTAECGAREFAYMQNERKCAVAKRFIRDLTINSRSMWFNIKNGYVNKLDDQVNK